MFTHYYFIKLLFSLMFKTLTLLKPIATVSPDAKSFWRRRSTWYFMTPTLMASSLLYMKFVHFRSHFQDETPLLSQQMTPRASSSYQPSIFSNIKRILELTWIFLPSLICLPLYLFQSTKHYWIDIFLSAVKRAGIVWIKAFQYLSHRGDIIGEDLAKRFSVLRDHAPTHTLEVTKKTIEKAFGKPVEQVFDSFQYKPVASGSVSQVYRATFKGKEVAVKVRHPFAGQNLQRDIDLLFGASRFLSMFSHKLQLPVTDASFKKILAEQLNLSHEKRNLDKFNTYEVDKHIRFPAVYAQSTQQVLIQQFIQGESIGFYEQNAHPLNRVIANIGAKAFFSMLMKYNFTHADCHAGNIMVQLQPAPHWLETTLSQAISTASSFLLAQLIKVGFDSQFLRRLCDQNYHYEKDVQSILRQSRERVELVLIDVGMVVRLSRQKKAQFQHFLQQMIKGDPVECARWVYRISQWQGRTLGEGENQLYLGDLQKMFREVHKKTLESLEGITVLRQMLGVIREHGMKLDGDISILLTNMLILQGIAKDLDPTINILRCAVPYLQYA